MPIKREFLGWDRPGLSLAVDWLIDRFGTPDALDLGRAIVAVPGGRAGRRLLERLVEVAEASGRALGPPRMITIGRLPELLYAPKRPFADALTQQLAWVEALRAAPAERLNHLVPERPDADNLPAWLSLGEMLGRLHRELAAEAMDFDTVLACGQNVPGFAETPRWTALAAVQKSYLETLDRLGLWDLQTARLFATRQGECRTDSPIILLGTVDLNRLQREMLEAVADHVTSLVLAPPVMAERFDALGCLEPDAWQELPVEPRDEQIAVADSPGDQAAAALRAIAALDGRHAADEITVGVPDERIVPYLLQQFRQCGVAARHGVGEPLARTGPYRLLEAAAECVDNPRHAALAALVRHPAVGHWLERQNVHGDWLTELDRYHEDHLPYRIEGDLLGKPDEYPSLRAALAAVETLLRPLSGPPRSLGEWSEPVAGLLVAVHGGRPLRADDPADRRTLAACEKIHAVLTEHRAIDSRIAPKISAAEAIRLALRAVASETIAAPADAAAVELLGWLELPLDDAPALVVTGMNEGIVPQSLGADLFLPNQMRRALGIEDNHRRWARDVYAMSMLVASGRHLNLIAGRRSPENDPMLPSRLLLASADASVTARRVQKLFGEHDSAPRIMLPGRLIAGRVESALVVPEPAEIPPPPESMRVTEFRDYLACPYRYYLRHRLNLDGLDDRAAELDGGAFGSLAHEVLGSLAHPDVADSTDAERIAAFLDASLDREMRRFYGGRPLASIRVQVEQLRLRLRRFAEWQAARAASGWRIEYVEQSVTPDRARLNVDDRPIGLRGRIDRIDVNDATGRRIVLDYKTGDKVDPPDRSHRHKDKGWIDLQLPLYRHLVPALQINGPVALGYVALPKDVKDVRLLEADWTDADLEEADETARRVVRDIRAGRFWPPASPPPAFCEEFAAICQDGQFGAALAEDDENGEEAES